MDTYEPRVFYTLSGDDYAFESTCVHTAGGNPYIIPELEHPLSAGSMAMFKDLERKWDAVHRTTTKCEGGTP